MAKEGMVVLTGVDTPMHTLGRFIFDPSLLVSYEDNDKECPLTKVEILEFVGLSVILERFVVNV